MYLIKPVTKFEKISSRAFKTEVINELSDVLYDKKVKFDSNPFLLGFNSKVYDLQNGIYRNYKPSDYMTMIVGYDIDRKNRDATKRRINESFQRYCWRSSIICSKNIS